MIYKGSIGTEARWAGLRSCRNLKEVKTSRHLLIFTLKQNKKQRQHPILYTIQRLFIHHAKNPFIPVYTPAAALRAANLGVPRPVTGSQPDLAGNPLVLHPGFDPDVMSLNALGLA
jgi:hypothetical protein